MASAVTLRTPRLILRPWRAEDRAPFAALNADAEVMAHFPSTLDRARSEAMADRIDDAMAGNGWGLWAVEVIGGPAFIGFTGLDEPAFDAAFTPCVEIGWRLARAQWGHGYATEAARAALAFAFGDLGLDEVVSFTAVTNTRSRAVMQRLGMRADGEFDHPALPEGHRLRRHLLYRLQRT